MCHVFKTGGAELAAGAGACRSIVRRHSGILADATHTRAATLTLLHSQELGLRPRDRRRRYTPPPLTAVSASGTRASYK
jgi:hypothetical protein